MIPKKEPKFKLGLTEEEIEAGKTAGELAIIYS